jgi:hypothetical protein
MNLKLIPSNIIIVEDTLPFINLLGELLKVAKTT